MSKTTEELEALKKSWLADPCWDIEQTEGFEDYQPELLGFRKATEAKWRVEASERLNSKATKLGVSKEQAKALSSFEEIERELSTLDLFARDMSYSDGLLQLVIAREQVRATLLLAAQVQRVGDLLEELSDEPGSDIDFSTNLYKVK